MKTKEVLIKPILFCPGYFATSEGDVIGKRDKKPLKVSLNKWGYKMINLKINGKWKFVSLHRIIALVFIPNIENKRCVNHINSDRGDNRVENLEWCTDSENILHGYNKGFKVLSKSVYGFMKPILNTENNIIYKSVTEAAKQNNINRSKLSLMLNGRIENTTKLKYNEK